MDRNSVTGLLLIAAILFGFTFFQSRSLRKQQEIRLQQDSIARVQYAEAFARDSIELADAADTLLSESEAVSPASIYKDSLLEAASRVEEEQFVSLENELVCLTFTSKGAQPYSARIKDYRNYDGTDLYMFKDGLCEYAVTLYAGENIKTSDFNFAVESSTDTSVVFVLPFSKGGCIRQSYTLHEGTYSVSNKLIFDGASNFIPRNVSNFDIDFSMVVPRMEKGFKNESQYSKLDYYFEGEKKPEEIGRGRSNSKRIDSSMSWFAFQQQFFSTIFRAPGQFASGQLSIDFFAPGNPDRNLMTCKASMRADLDKSNPDFIEVPFELYVGPNHFKTLKDFDHKYEKIIPLGGWLVGWFTRFVIIPMFNWLHRFISNFGLIILLMTIVIKTVILPLTYKSYSSSAKMQALKPEIEKINEKYQKPEDAMKKQQATMDLYKKVGASPMGGCLPTLLTFPILWAMFRFFPASIELRQQPFLWCDDLSSYDAILEFGHRVPLIGDHLSLFALLMAVTMWFYSKMTTANQATANDPNAASMKFMSVWMMPIMMFFICNSLSAALSYYYLLSNLYTMLQMWIIKKFCVDPDDILAKARVVSNKPVKKSKWQLRLEEAQKMQQQQMQQQQRRR